MVNFYLLRCILLFATGFLLVACSPKSPAAERVHAPTPPLDDTFRPSEPKVVGLASRYGAFGYYYDESANSYVIVFPSDVAVPTRKQTATELGTEVRIKQVEMTKDDYDSIESEVARLHGMHRGSTYSVYLDLVTGRAVLSSDLPQDTLEPLLQKYSDLLEFKRGSIRTD